MASLDKLTRVPVLCEREDLVRSGISQPRLLRAQITDGLTLSLNWAEYALFGSILIGKNGPAAVELVA